MELLYGRNLELGQKVRVYVNLHKGGRFSIMDTKTGLVCGYASSVLLYKPVFFVSPSGRLKVLETKRKAVHAWVKGIYAGSDLNCPFEYTGEVNYNPYLHEGFTDLKGSIITTADMAYLANKRVYIT